MEESEDQKDYKGPLTGKTAEASLNELRTELESMAVAADAKLGVNMPTDLMEQRSGDAVRATVETLLAFKSGQLTTDRLEEAGVLEGRYYHTVRKIGENIIQYLGNEKPQDPGFRQRTTIEEGIARNFDTKGISGEEWNSALQKFIETFKQTHNI